MNNLGLNFNFFFKEIENVMYEFKKETLNQFQLNTFYYIVEFTS